MERNIPLISLTRNSDRFIIDFKETICKLFGVTIMQKKETHYSFFQNRECEYFPCHEGADADTFNCLFCYCPLYALGRKCGGNCRYTESGSKDCSACTFPHKKENYEKVLARYNDIMELVRRVDEK